MSAAAPPATSQKEAAAQQQQQQPTMDTTPPPQTEPQGEKTSAHAETAAAGKEGTTNNAAAAQPPASGDELNIEQFAFRLPNYYENGAAGASTTDGTAAPAESADPPLATQTGGGLESLGLNDPTSNGMSVPAGMQGQMNGYQHPVSVDPYSYLSNLNMQGGMPPQMSAHAAYMSLPNNIVPNVNFLGGQNPGQQGSFMTPGISLGYAMRSNNMQQQQQMAGQAPGQSICKFYLQGQCARGEQCNYAHVTPTKGMTMLMHPRRGGGGNRDPYGQKQHRGMNGPPQGIMGPNGEFVPHQNGGGMRGGRGGHHMGHQMHNGGGRGNRGMHQQQRMMQGYQQQGMNGYPNMRGQRMNHHQHQQHMNHMNHMNQAFLSQQHHHHQQQQQQQQFAQDAATGETATGGEKTDAAAPGATPAGSLLSTLPPGAETSAAVAPIVPGLMHQQANPAGAMQPLGMHNHYMGGVPPMMPGMHGQGQHHMGMMSMGLEGPGHMQHHVQHHHQQHHHHAHHGHHQRDPYGQDVHQQQQQFNMSPMSDLLAKFTSGSSPEELTGHIYLIAKDQYGCRLLQRMLDEQKPHISDLTFTEVFDHMNELMTDPFGNYLCQKLIEHCNESQRFAIIQKVAPDLVAISLNMHGTRAVQKLVETISTPKEVELVIGALRASVVTLIKDLNGNHVIQRCLHHLNSKDNQFIYDAVSRQCVSVATHKHGCCVLQRTIDYATIAQKRQLVQEIVANALELVQDAFGNYVVQYVLDLGEAPIAHGIMQNLLGNISSLAVQKFSSNVVEKLLELANEKMRVKLIDELVNPERLPRLLQDPYANYCLQKALAVSKKQQFERLVSLIKPHLIALRNTSFGKRIQSKILKKFPDLNISFDSLVSDPNGEINPIVMNAMVSGMSQMGGGQQQTAGGGKQRGASNANNGNTASAATRSSDNDVLDGVNGAPGGMNINPPAYSVSPDDALLDATTETQQADAAAETA